MMVFPMKKSNIFSKIDQAKIDEKVGIGISEIVKGENVSFHIAVVKDKVREHYHKERDEIYYIVKGKGILKIDDEESAVTDGDVILIPKGSKHSLRNLEVEPLILVFISAPPFAPERDRFFTE